MCEHVQNAVTVRAQKLNVYPSIPDSPDLHYSAFAVNERANLITSLRNPPLYQSQKPLLELVSSNQRTLLTFHAHPISRQCKNQLNELSSTGSPICRLARADPKDLFAA